ncbi:2-hydroxyacid dehydrogenase [Nitratireductor sp. GCM10026969]|uniref:2-hydroxyacid dehydrogenase n=1 Tax=Nitratireductor sp. GCM10026969 TaxID=3252645 RepID=UPI003614F300
MTRKRILLTRRWPEAVETRLASSYDATLNPEDRPMNVEEIGRALRDYDAVCPTVSDKLPAEIFSAPPQTKILANFGVGVNHIDLPAAAAAGITVTNTPGVLTDCTADLAIALMLMLARRLKEGERELRAGTWAGWRPTHLMGMCLRGKTLGIIGMGRIGQATARRAQMAFGMDIVYYNRTPMPDARLADLKAHALPTVDAVIEQADFVSLHCPGGGENRHLIDARRIGLFGPKTFLINTARGDVVDETALRAALRQGALGGAGLDVFEREPHVPDDLIAFPNVVLLPHLGSATRETREAMGMMAADNLDAFFAGTAPPNRI